MQNKDQAEPLHPLLRVEIEMALCSTRHVQCRAHLAGYLNTCSEWRYCAWPDEAILCISLSANGLASSPLCVPVRARVPLLYTYMRCVIPAWYVDTYVISKSLIYTCTKYKHVRYMQERGGTVTWWRSTFKTLNHRMVKRKKVCVVTPVLSSSNWTVVFSLLETTFQTDEPNGDYLVVV